MALGNPINVRLNVEKQQHLEAEAAAHGVPLGTYLRQRIESADDLLNELTALRRAVERMTAAVAPPSTEAGQQVGVQLEMLLLLRQIAQGQKTQVAQQEMKRLGFEVWDGQRRSNTP